MADPQFGSTVQPLLPQSERYAQFKQQQAHVMKQHEAYAAQLTQQQDKLDAKKGDVDIAGKLMKVLDSRLPKPARQFLAQELAKHVGADPKSEQAKGVTSMLTSLDPGALQNMRAGLAGQLDQAEPGQISQMAQGILTGKIPMDQFIDQMGPALYAGSQGGEEPGGGGGSPEPQVAGQLIRAEDKPVSMGGTAGEPAPAPADQPITSEENIGEVGPMSQAAPAPFQPGAPGEVASFEGQRTIPPTEQAASPSIVGALGLDSKNLYRNKDLIQNGFKIPYDAKDQDKIAQEINTRSTGLSATFSEASKLTDLFEGHPEVLGTVGSGVQTLQSTIQQVKGLMNLINPALKDETIPYDAELQKLARTVSTQLGKMGAIDITANNAAQVDSMVLGLAYRMAIANDIPGNRLTNVILEQNLRQLGASSSPTQFKATLANALDSTTREFNESIQRTVGAKGTDIIARQMSQADLDAFGVRAEKDAKSGGPDLLPLELRKSLLAEALRRKAGDTGPAIKPSSPTIEEEQHTLGQLETQKKGRDIVRQDQTLQLEQQREQRAGRSEERANDREDRVAEAQAANAKLAREQFDYSRSEHERDNAFQREQFEYRKGQDRKAEDKARSDKIAAAFQHFGSAIAGSVRGGGGGNVPSLGGGQDVSAFRMTPAPQRVPPRPGGR